MMIRRFSIFAILVLYLTISARAQTEPQVDPFESRFDSLSIDSAAINLVITSSPDSASIYLESKGTESVTPAGFTLSPGKYTLEVVRENYEPLAQNITLQMGTDVTVGFILKAFPPLPLTAESLGMEYKPIIKPRDLGEADAVMQRYSRLAEVFAIIPFGQGLLGKFLASESNQKEANILLISGAFLSIGSYTIGKIASSRKRKKIEKHNLIAKEENELIMQENKEIDQLINEQNRLAVDRWLSENSGRGKVVIDKSPSP